MKKPKVKKPVIKTRMSPVIVKENYMQNVLPYKHPLSLVNNREIDIMCEWCTHIFPADEWRCNRNGWPGHFFFLKESYLTLFLLKWAK